MEPPQKKARLLPSIPEQESRVSSQTGTLNGREVFYPFTQLSGEVQLIVAECCDDSTRMSLYLTCWEWYRNPYRKPMSWPAFARATMLDGNAALVKFGLEKLHMDPNFFHRFIVEAAKRDRVEVVEMEELIEKIPYSPDYTHALIEAVKNGAAARYIRIRERLSHPRELPLLLCLNDLALLQAYGLRRVQVPGFWSEVLAHANYEVMQWLVQQRENLDDPGGFRPLDFLPLGSNSDPRIFFLFNDAFPNEENLSEAIIDACTDNNLKLLKLLIKLKNAPPLTERHVVTAALEFASYDVFEFLLENGAPWDSAFLLDCNYLDKLDPRFDGWLPKVVSILEKRGLLFRFGDVQHLAMFFDLALLKRSIAEGFDLQEKIEFAGEEVDLLFELLNHESAPDKYEKVKFLMKEYLPSKQFTLNFSIAIVYSMLVCPGASYTQKTDLIKMTPEAVLEQVLPRLPADQKRIVPYIALINSKLHSRPV